MHSEEDVLRGAKAIAKRRWLDVRWEHLHADNREMCMAHSRCVLDSQPRIEPDAGLVDKCADVIAQGLYNMPVVRVGDDTQRRCRLSAEEVLRVALNDPAVRPVITDEEIKQKLSVAPEGYINGAIWCRDEYKRRSDALLSPAKPKPWSERVTVKSPNSDTYQILIDGEVVFRCGSVYDAQIYRLGLIAQKEQEQAQ